MLVGVPPGLYPVLPMGLPLGLPPVLPLGLPLMLPAELPGVPGGPIHSKGSHLGIPLPIGLPLGVRLRLIRR